MTGPVDNRAFGQLLRSLREGRRLSMSAVARAIQVSVVYYRDVERGTRRPFSSIKIDFAALATILGTDAGELQRRIRADELLDGERVVAKGHHEAAAFGGSLGREQCRDGEQEAGQGRNPEGAHGEHSKSES